MAALPKEVTEGDLQYTPIFNGPKGVIGVSFIKKGYVLGSHRHAERESYIVLAGKSLFCSSKYFSFHHIIYIHTSMFFHDGSHFIFYASHLPRGAKSLELDLLKKCSDSDMRP